MNYFLKFVSNFVIFQFDDNFVASHNKWNYLKIGELLS
jgi:hypothetical protein